MSRSSGLGWWTCEGWQPCNCLRIPKARRFQESRMPGNPLVRFDEGRVGRTRKVSPSLLLYRSSAAIALPCCHECAQAAGALGGAKLAQRFGFDLANSFARDFGLLADRFEAVLSPACDGEAHAGHFLHLRREGLEDAGGF